MADTAPQNMGMSQAEDLFDIPDAPEYNDKLLPAGAHAVVVERATFEMKKPFNPVGKDGKPQADKPTVVLFLRPLTPYTDTDGGSWKPLWLNLTVTKNEMSTMFVFFPAVMGFPVSELKNVVRQKQTSEDGRDTIMCPQFLNAKFSVVVKLGKTKDGKPKAFVDSFFATPEQQAANATTFRTETAKA